MSSLDTVLAALEATGCKPRRGAKPDQHYAKCPAHDGKDFDSLSVGLGTGGKVLLHCHSKQCRPDWICEALGLEVGVLFTDEIEDAIAFAKDGTKSEELTLVRSYQYHSADGQVLFEVQRYTRPDGKKTFKQRHLDATGKWQWSMPVEKRVLYRLPKVLEAAVLGEPVFFVEGEKDADRLAELGLCAPTAPGGALPKSDKWLPAYSEALRGADVIIIPDNDEPGRISGQIVAQCLEGIAKRVRVLPLPGLATKGDVSDWLDAGHGTDELKELVAAAKGPPKKARLLAEILEDPEALKLPEVIIPGIAWRGRLTLLVAREKVGKSTLLASAVAAMSSGRQFLSVTTKPGRTLWVGLEEASADAARRFAQMRTDPMRVMLTEYLVDRMADVKQVVSEWKPDLIVIDSLAALGAGRIRDWSSAAEVAPLMMDLVDLCRQYNVAIVLIHHAKKGPDGGYRDSTAIGAAVDVILEMTRHGREDATRHLEGVGRWRLEPLTLRFDGLDYYLADKEAPLKERVIECIRARQGITLTKVRENVRGNNQQIKDALDDLVRDLQLEIRDTEDGHQGYFTRLGAIAHDVEAEKPNRAADGRGKGGARAGSGNGSDDSLPFSVEPEKAVGGSRAGVWAGPSDDPEKSIGRRMGGGRAGAGTNGPPPPLGGVGGGGVRKRAGLRTPGDDDDYDG